MGASADPPAEARLPTEGEVLAFFDTLSNWGRWGAEDERGTLNLITPEAVLRGIAAVRSGESVGCARPIAVVPATLDNTRPPLHFMLKSGEAPVRAVADGDDRQSSASDFLGVVPHGFTITHVDALSHVFWDDHLYNGFDRRLVTTAEGATVASVETMKDGVLTRGVLFDVAGHLEVDHLDPGDAVGPDELEEIERSNGVRIGEGDALLLRTGWPRRLDTIGVDPAAPRSRPGLHASCLPWLRERGVAIVAADASNDVEPSGYPGIRMPVHAVGMVAMGLCLVDNCDFEDLIARCREQGRCEFLFVLAPARYRNATASPLTPLAVL